MSDNIKWRPIKTAPYNKPLIVTFDLINTYTAYRSNEAGERDLWFYADRPSHQTPEPTHWTPLPTKKGLRISKRKQKQRQEAKIIEQNRYYVKRPSDEEIEIETLPRWFVGAIVKYRIGNYFLTGEDAKEARLLATKFPIEMVTVNGNPCDPEAVLRYMLEYEEKHNSPCYSVLEPHKLREMCARNGIVRARQAVAERELLMRVLKRIEEKGR